MDQLASDNGDSAATGAPFAEVVGRDASLFEEICKGQAAMFGVAVKLLDTAGNRLVDVPGETSFCQYAYGIPACRQACRQIVSDLRRDVPDYGRVFARHCFSGAQYRVAPVHRDAEVVGKVVVGPFIPDTLLGPPDELTAMDPAVDANTAWAAIRRFVTIAPDRAEALAASLASSVEVVCFFSRRNEMTTDIHVQSIREAYAELSAKHDRLEARTDEIRRLDRRSADVVSCIGKQLRKPLTNVIAHAEMLSQGAFGDPTDDQRAFLETIIEEGEGLLDLADTLQELSRVQRGLISLSPTLSHVPDVMTAVGRELQRRADGREVALIIDPPGSALPPIWIDVDRLRRAIRYIVDNAIEHTPAGGIVHLRCEQEPGTGDQAARLVVEVKDNGPGIVAENERRVFEAFFSGERGHGISGGVGLGLTLAEAYVSAHGGEIVVQSEPNVGSSFRLCLPLTTDGGGAAEPS